MKWSEAYDFPVHEILGSYSIVAEDTVLEACDNVVMGQ
jgi:hypothetical protein